VVSLDLSVVLESYKAEIGILDLFIVGGDYLSMKTIRETTEIIVFSPSLIKLSMIFDSL
jgi:hypothetical protein